MTPPRVTAIVCVFNGERHLRTALESIRAQRDVDMDGVVVDDGSTDGTPEILAEFQEFRVLRTPNRGAAAARNEGIRIARGDYIAFLDHDDAWFPEKTIRQVNALVAQPETALVGCHAEIVLEDARPDWLTDDELERPQPCWLPSALLVRAEVFRQIGEFDPGFKRAEDYDWLIRASRAGFQRAMLSETLVRRRLHEGNQSHDRAGSRHHLLRALAARKHGDS